MMRTRTLCAVGLLGLLMGTAANADHRHGYSNYGSVGYYPSGPQVRLGVDVVWGAYPYAAPPYVYAPPRPAVVWYPAHYRPYPYYDRGRGHWRNRRHDRHDYRH